MLFKSPTYVYESLEAQHSIRLLNIVPIESEAGTKPRWHYSLIDTNTRDAPEYETLSYVWGTSNRNKSLKLSDGTSLRTTKILEQALPHIVRYCTTGYLWIDQICINQDDLAERAQQVTIMGDIYSKCKCVLVWPGRLRSLNANFAAQCLSLDRVIASPRPPRQGKSRNLYKTACKQCEEKIIDEMICCKPRKKQLLAFCHEIVESSWFSRAWVFQEVVLPRRSAFILQGYLSNSAVSALVALPTLYALCKAAWYYWSPKVEWVSSYKRERLITTSRYGVLKEMYDRWEERHTSTNPTSMPLDQVLSLLSSAAKTSTAQDRLYAFFGMNQNEHVCLSPSYEISLQDALVATARSIIEGTKSLDIFETVPRKTTSDAVPSWVPNFMLPRLVIPFVPSSACTWGSNTRSDIYSWRGRCNGATLWVHGKVVAVLDLCVERPTVPTNVHDINRVYNPLLLKAIETWCSSRYYHPNVPSPTLETMLSILLAEGHCEPSTYDPGAIARLTSRTRNDFSYRQQAISELEYSSPIESRMHFRKERTMVEYIETIMKGRQLWVTQDGRLATGSRLQEGDLLCVLHGCSHPVALRRIPKKETYTVLSTCYLEDWMDPWGKGKVDWKEEDAEEFALV